MTDFGKYKNLDVGGLIGVLKSRNNIGLYGSIKDFDQATQIGYYILVGSNDNSILNKCGIDYGLMIYLDGAGNKRYELQYAFDMFNKKIAYRMTDTNGIWQEWAIFNATT